MLHMGIARQANSRIVRISFLGTRFESIHERQNVVTHGAYFPLAPQANCGCHLVVTATTRVDTSTRFTRNLSDTTLNGRMNVFIGCLEHKCV